MKNIEKLEIILITSIISIICSVLIIVLLAISGSTSINDFQISDIKYEAESDYFSSYKGTGKITCKNKNETYLVIYSEKLISGGDYDNIGKINYECCIIHNGEGEIITYDSALSSEKIKKPNYEFEIIACQKLDK